MWPLFLIPNPHQSNCELAIVDETTMKRLPCFKIETLYEQSAGVSLEYKIFRGRSIAVSSEKC